MLEAVQVIAWAAFCFWMDVFGRFWGVFAKFLLQSALTEQHRGFTG